MIDGIEQGESRKAVQSGVYFAPSQQKSTILVELEKEFLIRVGDATGRSHADCAHCDA
jgi:hypothetical protein